MRYFLHILPLLCCTFACSVHGFGQDMHTDTAIAIKPKWIEKTSAYISLKLAESTEIENHSVHTSGDSYELYQNAKFATRISCNYEFISLSFRFIPKIFPANDDDNIRGSSRARGLGLHLNFRHWQQSFTYDRSDGYYLKNTSDFVSGWKKGDPYIQIPDLRILKFEGLTAYSFNPRFSVRSIATQTERQLKSAGSFIPQIRYCYTVVNDRTPLTTPNASSQQSGQMTGIVGAGYYYNFIIKHNFYFALGLSPGIGINYVTLITRTPTSHDLTFQTNAVFRLDGRSGAGYNGKRAFAGISAHGYTTTSKQAHTTAVTTEARIYYECFIGYRFNAPKPLQKQMESMKSKMEEMKNKIPR